MRPTIEPYSPFCPSRRERRHLRIEWLIAAAAVSAMLWWTGWLILQMITGEK